VSGYRHRTRRDFPCGFFLVVDFRSDRRRKKIMRQQDVQGLEAAAAGEVWWLRRREELLQLAEQRLNAFVYDTATIAGAVGRLREMKSIDRVLYAMKANFNPDILRFLASLGVDFECVSPGEVQHLLDTVAGLDKGRILFTPNFAPRSDYEWARSAGIRVTLDNLYPLRAWPEVFAGQQVFLRMDPGVGGGHHDHVKTTGLQSKFGIPVNEVDEVVSRIEAMGAKVVGIHAHSGSGIPNPENWRAVADELARVADRFPDADVLDLGGGLGVPDRLGDAPFDLQALDAALLGFREKNPGYRLWLEPGRFIVAESGVLLTHVTQVKGKGDRRYVGVSTGMNSLIRPALYNAYHEIVNLTRLHERRTETVTVVGPICETGDRLGADRLMPPAVENDVIVIANTGAYGRAMSSQYNLRPIPEEIVI
jgi:diaminopimelate decarboxylase/aspartate kinase